MLPLPHPPLEQFSVPGHDRRIQASKTASVPEHSVSAIELEESSSEMSPSRLFATPSCADPFAFASIQLLLAQRKKHSSRAKRQKIYGRVSLDGKRSHGSKKKGRKGMAYLKPGALAQFRDAQRSARSSCCRTKNNVCVGKENNERAFTTRRAAVEASMAIEATPSPSVRVFGPVCPQRKKLVAPKTPANSVSGSHTPTQAVAVPPGESRLESLPLEILVRIICSLHHDQLKPAFHICKRLRQAVLIARQCHFNFTTPNRDRQEPANVPFLRGGEAVSGPSNRPPTPQAPRPPPKPAQARISLADIRPFAVPLFQSSSRSRQSRSHSMRRFNSRAAASHRVLVYEDELCQAVAQNSI